MMDLIAEARQQADRAESLSMFGDASILRRCADEIEYLRDVVDEMRARAKVAAKEVQRTQMNITNLQGATIKLLKELERDAKRAETEGGRDGLG